MQPGWELNPDHAIKIIVKTMPLPSWPCCRYVKVVAVEFMQFLYFV